MTPQPSLDTVWRPDPQATPHTSVEKFRKAVNAKYRLNLETYEDLHRFSTERLEDFWATLWEWSGIRHAKTYERVLSPPDARPGDLPRWFQGATLSLAENLLFPVHPSNRTSCNAQAPRAWPAADTPAVVEIDEGCFPAEPSAASVGDVDVDERVVTWGELRSRVARLAEALRGVGAGEMDRVAHVAANTSQPMVTLLAANSLGAVFSSLATDAGRDAIRSRLRQVRPRVVFCDEWAVYAGKRIDLLARMAEVAEEMAKAGEVVEGGLLVVGVPHRRIAEPNVWRAKAVRFTRYADLLASQGVGKDRPAPPLRFSHLPFDHPAIVVFSSGTTGEPKPIVHGAGNLVCVNKKEALLQYDLRPTDALLQLTTCGWIMWNLLVGVLVTGCSVVAYDGSPVWPDAMRVPRLLAARTHLGDVDVGGGGGGGGRAGGRGEGGGADPTPRRRTRRRREVTHLGLSPRLLTEMERECAARGGLRPNRDVASTSAGAAAAATAAAPGSSRPAAGETGGGGGGGEEGKGYGEMLRSLRLVTSTGSPLGSADVRFFYGALAAPHTMLMSISGGTDLAGCIVAGSPTLPVVGNLISCASLAMDVRVLDTHTGDEIRGEGGASGELCVVRPFPTQPLYFWGEDRAKMHEKYMDSYYRRFPGKAVWAQGDFVSRFEGGWEISGRSDGVLNPSGVRFGSSDIYSVLSRVPFVDDAIVVGQRRAGRDGDERVLLFVKLKRDGADGVGVPPVLTEAQVREINHRIRVAHSARHVPKHTFQVKDIPVTANGKKTELAVKAIVSGNTSFKPSSAIANPESLEEYRQYAEIEQVLARQGRASGKL